MTPTLREALSASPSLFPLNVDINTDNVQFVHLSEAEYASASFLDNRMLQPNQRLAWMPWSELQPAAQGLPLDCNFIFHISHAGSTLLSRLLACHPAFFSIREPAILRLFAGGYLPERLPVYLSLWSRTFHPEQTAVIKATSFVSQIAGELLRAVPNSRGILMYTPARTFLAALLDGAMCDIDDRAASRIERLGQRGLYCEMRLDDLSPGQRVAMSWLCEMLSLADAAMHHPDRVMWLDFDNFLRERQFWLGRCFSHFGHSHVDSASLLANSTMQRYAKRPEVRYDSELRSHLLAQADRKFATEITAGMAWLEHFFHQTRESSHLVEKNRVACEIIADLL